jgi:hypothetical protein
MTRKFSLLTAAALPLIPAAMFACGGDDGPKVTVKPDAAGSGSGSGSGSQTVCSAASSYASLSTFSTQQFIYRVGSGSSANLRQNRFTGANADGTYLRVILFGNCGSGSAAGSGCTFTTPTWPAQFTPQSGIDLSTNDDVLVLLLANLNADMTLFQDLYLGVQGTMNITSVANGSGQTLAANAANVGVVHLNDEGTDVHADGCESTITSFMFSGSAVAGAAGKPTVEVEYVDASSKEEALRKYLRSRHN